MRYIVLNDKMESDEWCYLYHINGDIVFKSNDTEEIEKEAKKYPFGEVRAGPKLRPGVCLDWFSLNDYLWKMPKYED